MRTAFGLPGVGARSPLGSIAPITWAPFRYQSLAAAQWDSEFSGEEGRAGGDDQVEEIVEAFKRRGESAGMRLAGSYGPIYVAGARAYVQARADSEEELAGKVAALTAQLARGRSEVLRVRREFLQLRLAEVRAAVARAQTPAQAVRDRPELATHARWRVHRAVPWLALAASIVGLGLTLHRVRGAPRAAA